MRIRLKLDLDWVNFGAIGRVETDANNATIARFEDLDVWKLARELAKGVYRASKNQPLRRDLAMQSQMKRAVISISSNIAEGFERGSRKQQIEFFYIAKGSAGELRSQVVLSHDNELIDDVAFEWLHERCERCARQLHAFIRYLRATREKYPGNKFAEKGD